MSLMSYPLWVTYSLLYLGMPDNNNNNNTEALLIWK